MGRGDKERMIKKGNVGEKRGKTENTKETREKVKERK